MKMILSFSIIAFSFLAAQTASARFVVGNGGDAIFCQKSSDNQLDGYYALDYVVTLASRKGDDGITPAASWDKSAERIYNLLLVKVPSLAPYFKEFRDTVFNKDYSKSKVWEATPFGLVELDDQNITSLIPENCKKDGKVQLTQAVIRVFQSFSGASRDHVIYKYDPDLVASLDKTSPLQLSFLMVHEWLWDLSQNVDRNRRINRFLHSKEIENMAPEVVIDNLKGMGFLIPSLQADVFDDNSCQGELMKKKDFDKYYPESMMTGNWGQLTIERRQRRLNCAGSFSCDMSWQRPYRTDDIYGKFRYFLGPIWEPGNRDYPIKIVSPDYLQSRQRFFRRGEGQFSCRITDDPKENLECKIEEPASFFYSLFGQRDDDNSKWKAVVLKGVLTTECMRLKVSGRYSTIVIEPQAVERFEDNVQETVFYLHAAKSVFLKPR